MPEVLAIEAGSFDHPWTEEEFLRVLRQRECIGMVAELGEKIVGMMVYELKKTRLNVLDFAVHPEFRRQRIGTQMVAKLVGKLAVERRTRITLKIRETNLDGQLFFRSQGFKAYGVARESYSDTCEDSFLMAYEFDGAGEVSARAGALRWEER